MRGFAAIRDEDRPMPGSLFGMADVLVEFPAGQGGDGHGENLLRKKL
jgi:hypothetical protein